MDDNKEQETSKSPSFFYFILSLLTELVVYIGIISLTAAIILKCIGVNSTLSSMTTLGMFGIIFVVADRIGKGFSKLAGNIVRGTPPTSSEEEESEKTDDDKGDSV